MAPWARKLSIKPATVDSFCPMATYTQITFSSRWLMIVSMAMAVLPVLRSPMIS
jgi:hypothetical protein